MKLKTKIVSVTAILIVVALISGYVFYINYQQPTTDKSQQMDLTKESETTSWKTYHNEKYGFEFKYLPFVSVQQDLETTTLSHSVAYRHPSPCDFKGDAPLLERLYDLSIKFRVVNKNPKEYIQSVGWPDWDYVSKNPYEMGAFSGYKIVSGIEGCGESIYYFTLSPTKTLVINRSFITELSSSDGEYQTHLKLPGIILPSQEEEFFNSILASFKFTNGQAISSGLRTYGDEKYGFEFMFPQDLSFKPLTTSFISIANGVEADVPSTYNFPDSSQRYQKLYVGITDAVNKDQCMPKSYFSGESYGAPVPKFVGNNTFQTYEIKGDCAMDGCGVGRRYMGWSNNTCYVVSSFAIQASLLKKYSCGDSSTCKNVPGYILSNQHAELALKQLNSLAEQILLTLKLTGIQNVVSDLKIYTNPEFGITFEYPAKYLANLIPRELKNTLLPNLQYKDPAKATPDFLDVSWLPVKAEQNIEQVMIDDVVFDGSGMHPSSFDLFKLVRLGENDFYKISTIPFEGVLGYKYYLVKESGAFVFKLTSNNVPWSSPGYDPEKDSRYLELQGILKTVKIVQ
ncbi:MAG: hypothetical protein EXS46_03265 [Candidatus Taylorbacteria bacterium]|nr:hypothetical protein [Candidatus Taylorbacteria bacterium]